MDKVRQLRVLLLKKRASRSCIIWVTSVSPELAVSQRQRRQAYARKRCTGQLGNPREEFKTHGRVKTQRIGRAQHQHAKALEVLSIAPSCKVSSATDCIALGLGSQFTGSKPILGAAERHGQRCGKGLGIIADAHGVDRTAVRARHIPQAQRHPGISKYAAGWR